MISISAIIALRNLPMMAINGFSSIFFYSGAVLFFFIPISLVCAELTSGWPKQGGVYAWVSEAFGQQFGALAIWLEWIESVVWLPTVLSFIAGTVAYLIDPDLADNRLFLLGVMLTVLWSSSILNFFGMKTSGWVSTVGIILGSIIPGSLII
ncbi:MAG TPA: amino acid permease, partial [Gammaproteobacteria bacterium]|nr:amino acid permease [Gammaproteobacteria bacterium]